MLSCYFWPQCYEAVLKIQIYTVPWHFDHFLVFTNIEHWKLNWIWIELFLNFMIFFMKIACTYNSQSFYCWFLKLVVIDLYFSLLTYYLFGSFVSQRFIISFLSISFWLNFVRQTWNIQTDANLYVIYLTAVHQIIVENVWISCF